LGLDRRGTSGRGRDGGEQRSAVERLAQERAVAGGPLKEKGVAVGGDDDDAGGQAMLGLQAAIYIPAAEARQVKVQDLKSFSHDSYAGGLRQPA
jgi:hypothetical protein